MEKSHADGLFLAGLLDALLAGVQRALLALGRLHHFLPRLGVYESNSQQETSASNATAHTSLLLLLEGKVILVELLLFFLRGLEWLDLATWENQ